MPRPARPDAPAWHALDAAETIRRLSTARDDGLTAAEAAHRLEQHGPNRLPVSRPAPWWRVLLRQFLGPLIAILLVAGVVTLLQRHWVDSAAIFIVLAINAALGFWQERKAERDVRALQSLSSDAARVIRDGVERTVDAEELVPGDVVVLESGERVAGDLRLIEANGLRVDESMLTGESLASTKDVDPVGQVSATGDRHGMAFSGTFVTSGRGVGVVVATGSQTELGEINRLIGGPAPKTPLQILTHSLERRVGVIVLISIVFVFIAGIVGGYDLAEMFRTAVALAVASIPESLPIILTVAMSVGVSRMARRGAIVRTLPSVETLGSTTVIASDKTGTLTQNRLTVEQVWTAEGIHPADGEQADALVAAVLRAGALTNEATRGPDGSLQGDAVDVAMATLALERGAIDEDERTAPPVAHTPYEPALRYSQTVRRDAEGRAILFVKGSPEVLVEMSTSLAGTDGPLRAEDILAANELMARDGLRVIATGSRALTGEEAIQDPLPPPENLALLGMEGMTDPPRPDVETAIADCRRAGIAVMMVTGDHPVTAEAIARRLGMTTSGPVLTGAEMAGLSDGVLAARLTETSVAARVSPHDKLRIVQALQERGDVVAVTGDGVNDAPALKAAAIGVAMGRSGTDVAREASDLVLTDDDFATIVRAVEQGRVTFAAIRKATFFLLSTAVAGVLALSINVLLDQPLLFLPVQILWINLVTSGIQDIALALEPAEGDELDRPPRSRSEGVLSRTLWFRTFVTGVWMGLVVLLVFGWALHHDYAVEHARTLAMAVFVLFNFFQVGSARAEYKSLFQLNPLSNRLLFVTAIGGVLLLWVATSWPVSAGLLGVVPLSMTEWVVAALIAFSVLIIVETEKLVRRLFGAGGRRPEPTTRRSGEPLP